MNGTLSYIVFVVWLFIKTWRGNQQPSTTSRFPTQKPICPACQAAEGVTIPKEPPPVLEYHKRQTQHTLGVGSYRSCQQAVPIFALQL